MPKNEMPVEETAEEKAVDEMPQEEAETADAESADTEDAFADAEAEEEDADAAESGDENGKAAAQASREEEALSQKYMRLAADFQNFKRRTEKEKTDIYQYANEKIALDIIEVMDNFDRALAHIEDVQDKGFAEGMEKIYTQLSGVLDKNNIIEIKAEGEVFDPNFHNAVMTEENPEFESGIVIQAMQKGYTLNGKVIRPSMVKVAR